MQSSEIWRQKSAHFRRVVIVKEWAKGAKIRVAFLTEFLWWWNILMSPIDFDDIVAADWFPIYHEKCHGHRWLRLSYSNLRNEFAGSITRLNQTPNNEHVADEMRKILIKTTISIDVYLFRAVQLVFSHRFRTMAKQRWFGISEGFLAISRNKCIDLAKSTMPLLSLICHECFVIVSSYLEYVKIKSITSKIKV